MKPLSELESAWKERIDNPEEIVTQMPGVARAAFRLAMMRCVDELQAWLREADAFVEENSGYFAADAIKRLLGTTQQEGEKL